ncbi:hypothetical protein RRG08_064390 [Elysia crispata]|uniref:Uncharacterized protein n=1 Tax=Elysia crispata TaxID=231223 RepID=A0AAE0YSZ1_9GAST|nr:hypothetical protein RRG08_064390 [Elysia crispata]
MADVERLMKAGSTLGLTYLDKWLHLPGKDNTRPEDIMDLFVVEQLIYASGNNLVVFLKERKPKTSDVIVELAENMGKWTIGSVLKRGEGHENRV